MEALPIPPINSMDSFVHFTAEEQEWSRQADEVTQKMKKFFLLSEEEQSLLFATMVKVCELQKSWIDAIRQPYPKNEEPTSVHDWSSALVSTEGVQTTEQIQDELLAYMNLYHLLTDTNQKYQLATALCTFMITCRDMIREERQGLAALRRQAQEFREYCEQNCTPLEERGQITKRLREAQKSLEEQTKSLEAQKKSSAEAAEIRKKAGQTILGFHCLYNLAEKVGFIASQKLEEVKKDRSDSIRENNNKEYNQLTVPMLIGIFSLGFFFHLPRILAWKEIPLMPGTMHLGLFLKEEMKPQES